VILSSSEFTKETIEQIVRKTISSILPNLPPGAIAGNKSLKDHGADSVDRVEIILSIMNELGMDEPMSNFSNIPNINELVDYLCRAQKK
jgi:polyketide biosynthesis acyl carrier protein